MSREQLLKGLTKEQIAKVKSCKSHEELLALAKAEGVELSNEQLEAVAGGWQCGSNILCTAYPNCDGSGVGQDIEILSNDGKSTLYHCKKCGRRWLETNKDF